MDGSSAVSDSWIVCASTSAIKEIRCRFIILARKDEPTADYARHRITRKDEPTLDYARAFWSPDQETLLFNTVRPLSCCGVFRGNY